MSTIKSDNSDLTINASGTSKDIKFQADGTERMVLKSDGKLGVGVAAPAYKLDTAISGNWGHRIGTAGGTQVRISDNTIQGFSNDTTGGKLVMQSNGGNLGIVQQNPAKTLDVTGEIRASGGILFGSDTATANALSDYETGTWTPVPSNCTGTATDTNYTKIGDTVHIWGRFSFATASGEISLSGLPYTPANNQVGGSIMLTGANIGGGSTYNVIIYFTTTPRILIYTSEDNSSWSTLSNSHIGNGDGIIFNGFYKV
jgi:hypothetical protein